MNYRSVLVRRLLPFLGCALALSSFASAQVNLNSQLPLPGTPPPRDGLLGQSYIFADFAVTEQRHGDGENLGPVFGANFAATDNFDLTTSLTYAHQKDWPDNGNLYQLGIDGTLHFTFGRVKLFGVAGAGYQLSRTPSGRDFSLWDAGVGAEITVARGTAVTLKAVNVGSFSNDISNPWQYTVAANHWFAPNWAGVAAVTFVEDQATSYSLGVRWGF